MKVQSLFHDRDRWIIENGISLRGKALSGENTLSDKEIIRSIHNIGTLSEAASYCRELNGLLSWIRILPDRVLLSVDHHRSVPLFYAVHEGKVLISDHANQIYRELESAMPDDLAAAEFLILGYISGNRTLSNDIRQVEAGTVVEITDKSVKHERYFRYIHNYRDPGRKALLHDLDDVVRSSIQRMVHYADGRPIIVPLSGGYDSRLLVNTLYHLKYPDVRCYTYGRKQSREAKISKEIADALGYSWTHVIYDSKKWHDWFHSKERRLYYRQASGLAGIPNIQEFLAVGEMKQSKWLPDEAVFAGGHHGGMLSGGKSDYDKLTYRDQPETNEETILSHILHYHYYLWDWSHKKEKLLPWFTERIRESLAPVESYPDSPGACESWNFHERQSKFIIHSGRIYEFFDYDWWMPYCDLDYLNYWLQVPIKYRLGQNLYIEYIHSQTPYDIPGYSPAKKALSIQNMIRKTPIYKPVQSGYRHYSHWKRRKYEYDTHPFAWYGILNKHDFRGRFSGRENINSFQSLELLRNLFENGFLSVDDILNRACEILQSQSDT